MAVPSSNEGLGLEVDTSDEEPEECVNDEHAYVESEDSGSSNDLENDPSSPIIPKSTIPPPRAPSRKSEFSEAEESVTGKPGQGYPLQLAKVVSEPEIEGDVSATKNKRKASELGFSIPPAKWPEPEEYSVMESESDFDDVFPPCLTAPAPALARSKDITAIHNCDRLMLTSTLRRFSWWFLSRR